MKGADVLVNVRLSGELARIGGVPRLAIELADGATVAQARAQLEARLPDLAGAVVATLPMIRASVASSRQMRG